MKKALLMTLFIVFTITTTTVAQFGIERKIRKKYEKKGMEHAQKEKDKAEAKALEEAQKGADAAEAKGMEEADKGLDKAQPGIAKGESFATSGLTKYAEFIEDYDDQVASKDPADYKKYPFESAIVEYTLEGSEKGSKTVYVDMGGYKVAEHKIVNISKKKQEQTAEILLGAEIITLDYEDMQAVRMQNPIAFYLADSDRDWQATGEKIFIKMGYEIVGTETILDKECNIWKKGKQRVWIWDGITLKLENGKAIETATNIIVDADVPQEKFDIPEGFEVEVIDVMDALPQITEEDINSLSYEEDDAFLDKIEEMSYADFKAMVLAEDPEKDEEEIRQGYLYLRQKAKMRHNK